MSRVILGTRLDKPLNHVWMIKQVRQSGEPR
jgi:hypothetical protein